MNGQRLLHYEILDKLGEGGMGVVYKARDTHLDRFVAVKVLPPEKVSDPTRKARFIQEAKAASALNHPNIITVHDISNENGIDFIVMEFVDGKTLDQLIPRKGMRLNEALKVAIQIADALARAHAEGIIHRDLKPANIMVDSHDQVKVLDFGLAKLTEQGDAAEASTATAAVQTEEGTIAGTAAYMSPEQAEGKPLDARSDIFSFGAVLYEMLTGHRAFQGDSKMSTLSAVLQKEPPPFEPVIPHDVARIVLLCLRKDPERRHQHMADLKVALLNLKEESDSGQFSATSATVRRTNRRNLWWAVAAVLCLFIASGLWLARRRQPPPQATLVLKPLTAYPDDEFSPSFSPDAKQIVFTWARGLTPSRWSGDIYTMFIGSSSPLRLTTSGDARSPAWSPDGTSILFSRRVGSRLSFVTVTATGGSERVVREYNPVPVGSTIYEPWAAWLPDSRHIVFADGQLLALDTGELQRMWSNPDARQFADGFISVSPDGRTVAFMRKRGMAKGEIYTLALDATFRPVGEPVQRTNLNGFAHSPAFTSGGKELLFVLRRAMVGTGSLYSVPLSGAGEPYPLPVGQDVSRQVVASSRPGRIAFVQDNWDSNIYMLPLDRQGRPDGIPRRIIASSRRDYTPEYSPDGTQIAFISDRLGPMGIWRSRADGSDPLELFSRPDGFADWPRWSPDGQSIVFSFVDSERRGVISVPSQGGMTTRPVTGSADDHLPSYSRDGKWLYFGSKRSGSFQVWKQPVAGGAAVQLTRQGGLGGLDSPDGKWVYYFKTIAEPTAVWRVTAAGGEESEVVRQSHLYSLAVVAGGIYYLTLDEESGEYSLQFKNVETGATKAVANLGKRLYQGISLSPDKRSLLFVCEEGAGLDIMLVENFR